VLPRRSLGHLAAKVDDSLARFELGKHQFGV
jgi:hypothetical protein